jgi:hypothetical protein
VLEAVIAALPTAPASSPRPAAPASVDIPMERWLPGTGTGETPDLVVLSPGMRRRRAGHAPVIDLTKWCQELLSGVLQANGAGDVIMATGAKSSCALRGSGASGRSGPRRV